MPMKPISAEPNNHTADGTGTGEICESWLVVLPLTMATAFVVSIASTDPLSKPIAPADAENSDSETSSANPATSVENFDSMDVIDQLYNYQSCDSAPHHGAANHPNGLNFSEIR